MKKLGVMLALMLCLTVVVPLAIAASSQCPVHDDGYHHYIPDLDDKPLYAENYGNETFHRQYYYHAERCACGDWKVCDPPYNKFYKEEYHSHNEEIKREYTGAARIDSQYHYRVYKAQCRCKCSHVAWNYNLVDRSVKQSHSFTNVVSSTTKNGKRTVVKKCACGEKKTFTYTVPPTQ